MLEEPEQTALQGKKEGRKIENQNEILTPPIPISLITEIKDSLLKLTLFKMARWVGVSHFPELVTLSNYP